MGLLSYGYNNAANIPLKNGQPVPLGSIGQNESSMKSFVKDTATLIKEEMRILVGQHELADGYFRHRWPDITVSPDTRFVIEGAPSSGNSFAVIAFNAAQSEKIRVAHHHHLPFQVVFACRSRIPCLVLIRHPLDAAVSRVARHGFYQPQTLQAVLWTSYALRHWVMFYDRVVEYRPNFSICDFSELVIDYPAVIRRVNQKFKTNFNIPSAEICTQSLSTLAEAVKPDKDREIRKPQFKEWIRRESRFAKLLKRAEELYVAIRAESSHV